MKKGFTLVEVIVTLAIVALLATTGILVVSSVIKKSNLSYYKSTESSLLVSGSNYYDDNRTEKPLDDYNFVSLGILETKGLIEEVADPNGNKCSEESGVYIYKQGDSYDYEVCLVCDDYRSEGKLCNGTAMGVIQISASYLNDQNISTSYNATMSFASALWVKATRGINVTFTTTEDVNKYVVYDLENGKAVKQCTTDNKTCNVNMQETGQYYVIGYDSNSEIVGNRKSFVIKNDKQEPSFEFERNDTELFIDDGVYCTNTSYQNYTYNNKLINVYDNYGIASIKYMLINQSEYNNIKGERSSIMTRMNASGSDVKKDNSISEKKASGVYALVAVVTDYAGNYHIEALENIYIKYAVKLVFIDNDNNKTNLEDIYVYYGSEYGLPVKVNGKNARWYQKETYVGRVESGAHVANYCSHTLYGREAPKNLLAIPSSAICKDVTYNGNDQTLVNSMTGITITGNSGKLAGDYRVTLSLNTGYEWDEENNDNSRRNITIICKIKKRPITCTADSYTKTYDAAPLSRPNSGSCLNVVSYDKATFVNTGSITDVGEVPNVIEKVTIVRKSDNVDVTDSYQITEKTGTLKVTKKSISIRARNQSKVYDCEALTANEEGTNHCTVASGLVTGQSYNCTSSGSITDVGSTAKNIDGVTIIASDNSTIVTNNYTITTTPGTLTVSKRTLGVRAANQSKTYDGTALEADTTYTISTGSLVCGQTLSITPSGSQKDVGNSTKSFTNIEVKEGSIDRTDNYTINKYSGTLTVTKKALIASILAEDKVYDRTVTASCEGSLAGVVGGDTVTISVTNCKFNNASVGTDKTVTGTVTISGASSGNYNVSTTNAGKANITKKNITAQINASNKTYNNQTNATCTATLTGVITGDTVSASVSNCNFDNANVGTGKTVTGTVTLSGSASGNYNLTTTNAGTANITQKALTAKINASSKTYDKQTSANCTATLTGVLTGDTVSASVTNCNFNNANVGTSKTVTGTVTISGASSGNYSVSTTNSGTANITKKNITAQINASNKTYDGTRTASCSATLTGVISGDTVNASVSNCNFDNANAGTGKTVTGTVSLSGTAGGNYNVSTTNSGTANITRKTDATTGSCLTNLYYTGSNIQIASGASNATYTGNSNYATTLGSHTVTVQANANHAFSDGTFTKTLSCTIEQPKTPARISCRYNMTYNGTQQAIATCSGGTIQNHLHTYPGDYLVTCIGDSTHGDASKSCSIYSPSSWITCLDVTENGSLQQIATCSNGSIYYGEYQSSAGDYNVYCEGDYLGKDDNGNSFYYSDSYETCTVKPKPSGGGNCVYSYFSCDAWCCYDELQLSSTGLTASGYLHTGSVCLKKTKYDDVYSSSCGYVYAPNGCFS